MAGEPLTGGCLCGGVRFTLAAPPAEANYCHCTRCQRRTGTAASANVRIDGSAFALTQGEDLVRGWRHPDGGAEKSFCGVCGAHLFARVPETGEIMSIRMSAFDADPGVRPSYRVHVGTAASWEPIPDDALPRFGESRPDAQ